jgi:hypothetical protein
MLMDVVSRARRATSWLRCPTLTCAFRCRVGRPVQEVEVDQQVIVVDFGRSLNEQSTLWGVYDGVWIGGLFDGV